jgi:WD40 repeat protein/tRNA A-37 threonylcarbamoyl transferase component Bud32
MARRPTKDERGQRPVAEAAAEAGAGRTMGSNEAPPVKPERAAGAAPPSAAAPGAGGGARTGDARGPGSTAATWIDTAPFAREELAPGESQSERSQAPGDWQPGALPVLRPDNRYALEGEIARGGLGRVLRARDRRLVRTVAIKELLDNKGTHARRFLREAQVTAALEHPSIVPIHDVGRWPDGVPFYAMKLVQGRSLEEVVRKSRRIEERLGLLPNLIAVTEALSYAHSHGVVHRDLKPLNIMLGAFGETLVIDWGLAKRLSSGDGEADDSGPPLPPPDGSADTEAALSPLAPSAPAASAPVEPGITQIGSVIGTPDYMAPEQARGEAVDTRADVYALGALVYFTLAGHPPYGDGHPRRTWRQVLAGPPPPLAKRGPRLAPDLIAIVDKAMARDPAARYPTATELAADLRRFQTGQLVGARRYTWWDLVRRAIRRHRAIVAVSAAAAVALAVLAGFSVRRIATERDAARAGRKAAEVARTAADVARTQAEQRGDRMLLLQAQSLLDRDPTEAIGWLKRYPPDGAEFGLARDLADRAVSRGVAKNVWIADAPVTQLIVSDDGRRLVAAGRGPNILVRELDGDRVWQLSGPPAARVLALSADGARVAVAGDDGSLHVFAIEGGGHDVIPAAGRPAMAMGFDLRQSLVVVGADGLLRHVAPTGTVVDTPLGVTVAAATVLGDGTAVLGGADGSVRIVAPGAGAAAKLLRIDGRITWLGAAAAGELVAVGDEDGRLTVFRGRARQVLVGHDGPIFAGAIAADGEHVATGSEDETARLWNLGDGSVRVVAADGAVRAVEFSRDGGRALIGDMGGLVRLVGMGGDVRALSGHGAPVWGLATTPDGRWLLTGSEDGSLRQWDLAQDRGRELSRVAGPVAAMGRSNDGRWLATAGADGISVWNAAGTGRGNLALPAGAGAIVDLGLADAGATVVAAHADGQLHAWLRSEGGYREVHPGEHGAKIAVLAVAPGGRRFATVGTDGKIKLWERDGGDRFVATVAPIAPTSDVTTMTFSADGAVLAAGEKKGTVHRYRLGTAAPEILTGHEATVRALAFSPSGDRLASGSYDSSVRLWPAGSDAPVVMKDHLGPVLSLAFAPDGSRLASGGVDGIVRIWDVASGTIAQRLRGSGALIDIVFSEDGLHVAAASLQGPLRLWSVQSAAGQILAPPSDKARACAFAPSGRALVCTAETGRLRLWGLGDDGAVAGAPPVEPDAMRAWLGTITSAVIDDDKTPRPLSPKP